MTDVHPLPAEQFGRARAARVASRYLHAIVDEAPAPYTTAESDVPVLLATRETEAPLSRTSGLGGLWFGLCVVVSVVVLVAYDAIVGFG